MIFSEEVDTSLWCIMKANYKNKNKIIELIKNIPQELLNQIRESLTKHKELEENGVYSSTLENTFLLNENEYYSYYIDMHGLTIEKGTFLEAPNSGLTNQQFPYSEFELSINYFDFDDPYYFIEEFLGSFSIIESAIYKYLGTTIQEIPSDDITFNYYKLPIGGVVTSKNENKEKSIPKFKLVSEKMMPKEITVDNLPKRRVRIKK